MWSDELVVEFMLSVLQKNTCKTMSLLQKYVIQPCTRFHLHVQAITCNTPANYDTIENCAGVHFLIHMVMSRMQFVMMQVKGRLEIEERGWTSTLCKSENIAMKRYIVLKLGKGNWHSTTFSGHIITKKHWHITKKLKFYTHTWTAQRDTREKGFFCKNFKRPQACFWSKPHKISSHHSVSEVI